jgi:hypothetical protein
MLAGSSVLWGSLRCHFVCLNYHNLFSGKFQLKAGYKHLEKPTFEMPKTYQDQPEQLMEQLRKIFNPTRIPAPTTGSFDLVPVQIQQLAAPLITAYFRIIPVQFGDHIRYMVTDVNSQNYVVVLHGDFESCNCPSPFFCHHILACRFRSGAQADLNIPANAKLPNATSHNKTEKRKRPGTSATSMKRPNLGDTSHNWRDSREAEEDEEDFNLPEPQDVLFLTVPDMPHPPVGGTSTGLVPSPVCVPPPPLGMCYPSRDVTRGFVEAVKLQDTQLPPVYVNFTSNIETPLDTSFSRPSTLAATPSATTTVTSATVPSPHNAAGSATRADIASLGLSQASVVLSRLPSVPTSPSGVGGTWSPIKTSTPSGTLSKCPITKRAKASLLEEKRKALELHKGVEDNLPQKKKGRKSVTFDSSVLDAPEITNDLEEEQLRMGPSESRTFKVGSTPFTFETKEPGLVIIHARYEDEVSASVKRAAATAGANQALPRVNSKDSSKAYIVKVSIHEEGEPETDLTDPEELEVSCVCGKAMSRRELGPSTINCTICQRMFHTAHAQNTGKRRSFTCLACSQPIQGLAWGEGKYENSCPVDGFLTSTSLAAKKRPSLLQYLRAYGTMAEKHLADSIEQALRNCSGEAKDIWGDYIVQFGPQREPFRTPSDLFGDVFARTAEALGPSVTFNLKTFCPNGSLCPAKMSSIQAVREFSLPEDCSSVEMGLDFILGQTIAQCETCCDNLDLPLVGHRKIVIANPKEPPMFFYLSTISLKFTPEDYMKGPQEILVDGIKYQLLSIHLFSHGPPRHYRTLIQAGDADKPAWLLYDGTAVNSVKKNFTRFRPALPSDYANHTSTEGYFAASLVFIQV